MVMELKGCVPEAVNLFDDTNCVTMALVEDGRHGGRGASTGATVHDYSVSANAVWEAVLSHAWPTVPTVGYKTTQSAKHPPRHPVSAMSDHS